MDDCNLFAINNDGKHPQALSANFSIISTYGKEGWLLPVAPSLQRNPHGVFWQCGLKINNGPSIPPILFWLLFWSRMPTANPANP